MSYSSGTFSMIYDFDTEAASPPIEIAKLTEQFNDIATGMSIAMLRDGTGLPTANQPMNGFTFTGAGPATTLTGIPRVTELIDQDHVYWPDSGSADTLVITPSPAIAAYEEGQRFVVRAAANNTGATTLNVNALGAVAVQTPDGVALSSGAILLGGFYEFTYDANASPDRWVMTSPPSEIPDGMLSSNVPLINAANVFTGAQTISAAQAVLNFTETGATAEEGKWQWRADLDQLALYTLSDAGSAVHTIFRVSRSGTTADKIEINATTLDLTGAVSTPNTAATEVGYKGAPSRNVTSSGNTAATDAGGTVRFTSGSGQTFTLDSDPPADSVVLMVNSSGNDWTIAASGTLTYGGATGSRTLATGSMCGAIHNGSGNWNISGQLG